eukprot:72984-Chlamydomonas_euryale.AAC.5
MTSCSACRAACFWPTFSSSSLRLRAFSGRVKPGPPNLRFMMPREYHRVVREAHAAHGRNNCLAWRLGRAAECGIVSHTSVSTAKDLLGPSNWRFSSPRASRPPAMHNCLP